MNIRTAARVARTSRGCGRDVPGPNRTASSPWRSTNTGKHAKTPRDILLHIETILTLVHPQAAPGRAAAAEDESLRHEIEPWSYRMHAISIGRRSAHCCRIRLKRASGPNGKRRFCWWHEVRSARIPSLWSDPQSYCPIPKNGGTVWRW